MTQVWPRTSWPITHPFRHCSIRWKYDVRQDDDGKKRVRETRTDEAPSLLAPGDADARDSGAVTTVRRAGLDAIGSDTSTTALGIVGDVNALEPADAGVVEALLVSAEAVIGTLGALGLVRGLEAGGLGW